jgi:predicted ribosome-associated RNA-binding protein Tma20
MKRSPILVAVVTALAMLVAATAAFAGDSKARTLYSYMGQLKGTSGSSLTVAVQNGNRAALHSLLGQSQEQTFSTAEKTVFLKWTRGIPTVVGIGDLAVNDYVTVNVRADRDASLDVIKGTPAATVSDRGPVLNKPNKPLYLFRGTFVSTEGANVTIDVQGGNHNALRLLIGQQARQAFLTDGTTVFLHWDKRIPTVIDASKLKAGDRIVVRVRADRGASLAEVEATAAKRVADREPKDQEAKQSAQA